MSAPRNPILIGQAEVIDLVPPAIRTMMQRQGIYMASDISQPGYNFPLAVDAEGVWSLRLDAKLDPAGFPKTVRVAGPFFAPGEEINPVAAEDAAFAAAEPVAAAPGIDPADPWRGLYAPERMPKLDGVNDWIAAHPDLPQWPDDEERGIDNLINAQGFAYAVVGDEYPDEDEAVELDPCAWLAAWEPEPPAGEHWRLVMIQDTEDGPAAVYVRPLALIDASPKGGSTDDFGAMAALLSRWRHNASVETSPLQMGKVRREVWVQSLSELEFALQATSHKGGSNKADAHALMAAEYQRWLDFFHAGNGDFNDFLRKELPEERMQATSAEVGA